MTDKSLEMLKEVRGIGDSALDNFKEAGFETLDDLRGLNRSDLKKVEGVGASTANSIIRLMEKKSLREKKPRTENQEKLQDLLRELFQFDHSELDFGIYRIMNQKRDEIEKFIDSELLDAVDEEFEKYETENVQRLKEKMEDLKEEIKRNFGEDAIDEDEEVIEMYKSTPKGKEYMQILKDLQEVEVSEPMEAQVFNDLYNFFKHYYDDGDFLTKRRYSRENKYAIPYNGEEVYLHWANKDQYYVKTAERFKDYRFRMPDDYFVQFELKDAEVDQNNTIGDKKYFLLYRNDPISYDSDEKTMYVRFEYRPLTDLDLNDYGLSDSSRKNTKADNIRDEIIDRILEFAADQKLLREALQSKEKGHEKTILEKNLYQYTKKHTSDYFIHKDLKGFLERELDFYIKNEIVYLDDLGSSSERDVEKYMGRVRVVKKIAKKIIDFLAQIEDFQKKLWEKKKFVVQTDYCITLDKIPEEYYPEILENEEQIEEWKELYKLYEAMEGSIEQVVGQDEIDENILKNHQSMMVDTKFFDEKFKDKLLAQFDNLDTEWDGLLIKSENWQALNLLKNTYGDDIKLIYIDPPYNTGSDEFIYKDNYRHSSWLTMIYDRIYGALPHLKNEGGIVISVDDNEIEYLKSSLNQLLGKENFVAQICVQSNPRGRQSSSHIAHSHEYLLTYAKNHSNLELYKAELSEDQLKSYKYKDENGKKYRLLGLRKRGAAAKREEVPNLYFPIYYHPEKKDISLEKKTEEYVRITPKLKSGEDGRWRWSKEKVKNNIDELEVRESSGINDWRVLQRDYLRKKGKTKGTLYKTIWKEKEYNYERGKEIIKDMFGKCSIDYPKPLAVLEETVNMGSKNDDIVMDFFAGSGTTSHAVASKNKEDGSNRRYIMVEMGDHFENLLKPRMQKLIYSYEWSECKPQKKSENSHIFKYIYLEQYEDALNNIQFKERTGQQAFQEFDDYMLNYMLEYETEGSPTLLDVDKLKTPFRYKLNIRDGDESEGQIIDIPETFNYLIGLKVSKRFTKENDGRKYLVYRGKIDDEFTIVIWRNTEDIDLEQDKEFITEKILKGYEENVYINQENVVDDSIPIEKIFKNKMEG